LSCWSRASRACVRAWLLMTLVGCANRPCQRFRARSVARRAPNRRCRRGGVGSLAAVVRTQNDRSRRCCVPVGRSLRLANKESLLSARRQPNRRCGCGGAGAHTAAGSDVALSQQYVRPMLLSCPSRTGHALRWGSHVARGAGFGACGGGSRWRGPVSALCAGVVVEARLLVACSQPNRSCECGGAGAQTAAESDDAQS
jgi:hypothetical protein